MSIPSIDNTDFVPYTKKYQDHIVCRYGYKLICFDERYSKLHKTYFGESSIDKILNGMIKESEYCSRVTEREFNKALNMNENKHEDFNNHTKCWTCKKSCI